MAFENDTNAGRVRKMVETLALIEKSATSNRADKAQVVAMLQPMVEALAEAGVLTTPEASVAPCASAGPVLTPGERAALHLADRASLRDLTAALLGHLEAHHARLADDDTEDAVL